MALEEELSILIPYVFVNVKFPTVPDLFGGPATLMDAASVTTVDAFEAEIVYCDFLFESIYPYVPAVDSVTEDSPVAVFMTELVTVEIVGEEVNVCNAVHVFATLSEAPPPPPTTVSDPDAPLR